MTGIPERWTRARVYPDMWTDPDQDPRNSDGVSLDGELATLRDYVRGYRLTLLTTRSRPCTATATPTSSANASTAASASSHIGPAPRTPTFD